MSGKKLDPGEIASPEIFCTKESEVVVQKTADFETAIKATGFGKFNILLIFIAIPAGWSSIFETTTMSYVFPAAQCDLDLAIGDKGLLNAVTYLGTISSALIWGYLVDTLGRKKLLIAGFFLDAVFVVISSFSQTKVPLMIAKFMGGFIINGPFAAFTTYISEFHNANQRGRMMLVMGTIYSLGSITLPLLALAIMPQDIYLEFFNKTLIFHSWNVYLLVCALPPFLSAVIIIFMPESPKFLMSMGQNEKALKVFQNVYKVNTGKAPETFPIKRLVDEIELKAATPQKYAGAVTANRTKIQALTEGFHQIRPLIHKPHLRNLILVCTLQTLFSVSNNTIRLWLPQIFQAINDYQFYNNGSSASICLMLEMIQPSGYSAEDCVVNLDNWSVYINTMTIAFFCLCSYFVAGYLIQSLGKKKLLGALASVGGVCCCSLYFSQNTATTLVLASIYQAAGSVGTNVVLAVVVDLFPTTLRTMTVAISMMLARAGSMIGNIIFPYLLQAGCTIPFFSIGALLFVCAFVTLLLPKMDLRPLQ